MGVHVLIRKKHRLLLFIMDEIPGGIVTPELNLPCRLKGCILIINMVQSLKLAEAIGVVQPAGFRHQVVGQAAVIRLDHFSVLPVFPVPCLIVLPSDLFIFFQAASSLPSPCVYAVFIASATAMLILSSLPLPPQFWHLPVHQDIRSHPDFRPQAESS